MRLSLVGITVLLIATLTAASGVPAPPEVLIPAIDAVRRGTCGDVLGVLRRESRESTPSGARAAYLLGHCLASVGRHDEAREAFLDASQRHDSLSAYARLGAARAALVGGDVSTAADLGRPPAGASAPVAARLLLVRSEALLRAGRVREAAAIARGLVRGEHPDNVLAEGWWLLGRASAGAGDVGTARSAYAMAWWGIPDNPHSGDAARRLRDLSAGRDPIPTAQARTARGLRLADAGDARAAERELALGVKGSLPEHVAAAAWYQLGLLRLGTRPAVSALQQAVRFPADRDRSLFWLGLAWLRLGRGGEATAAWARLRREYPDSLWSARAVATLGRVAEAAERWDEADRLYALLINRYPSSPRTDDARWRRAWMRHRRGQHTESRALFVRYGTTWPDTPRAAAHLYWAWRTSTGADRANAALLRDVAERYPLTFYGQRARVRLGLPPVRRVPAPGRRDLDTDRFHPAYEELAALGFDAEALEEVESRLADDAPATIRRAAAELYARTGNVTASIRTIEPLIDGALYGRRQLDDALWRLAYPRAFWPLIVPEAARHGLDPLLVLAVIREESRFDPRAVSSANAVGLMQLLPSTARGVLGRPVGPTALMEPALNIRAGTAYLAGLLRAFQGTTPLAVGAYNAGPGGVRRHAALARSDLDRFVEELPYAETRAYVQRVMQSYGIYRWLYE
ncbi:MAG TPA: transglycosylase SLT domain-containing protein [bacterium]|nr:transglycosylase SLT domain-containing protein [bacterium]